MGKGSLYKYWLTYGDWEGSRCLLQFDKPVTETIAKEKSRELKVLQENIQGYTSLAEAEADAEKMETNRAKDYGDKEVTKMRKVKASNNEDYGDTVVCCSVCGRIAIGERGEDYSQTVCVDCGNNEWKVLPFTKGANVRQDPNDGEVAQAGIRKRRVSASFFSQSAVLKRAERCKGDLTVVIDHIQKENYKAARNIVGEISNTIDFMYDELEELQYLENK